MFNSISPYLVTMLLTFRLLVLSGVAITQTVAINTPTGRVHDYKGLYVMIYPTWVPQTAAFENALSKPFIDGATVIMQWAVIEPRPGVFDFSSMDRWISSVVTKRKKISLGVMAGMWTPEWLYDSDHQVAKNVFVYNRSPQGTPNCTRLALPSPWHQSYIREYNQMMREVAKHLHQLQIPDMGPDAAYEALRIIKVAGINNTTEELRLYANMYPRGDPGPCHQSDAPPIWAAAGFTPTKVVVAWTEIASNLAAVFPGKVLSVDIIQVNAFPPVDDSGRVYRPEPRSNDLLTTRIVEAGISRFSGRFAVQWNALSNLPPNSAVVDAGARGAIEAWQMNEFLGSNGSGCIYGGRRSACRSPQDFQVVLNNGINAGGQFIEIWAQNVDEFASAFQHAHERLVQRAPSSPGRDSNSQPTD